MAHDPLDKTENLSLREMEVMNTGGDRDAEG